jgi:hypothetical protein
MIKPVTPWSQTAWNAGNYAVTSDPYIGTISIVLNPIASTILVTMQWGQGAYSGSNATSFTPDPNTPPITIQFSTISNTWSVSTGGAGGTLTAGQITSVNNILNGSVGAAAATVEQFAITNNIFGSGATYYAGY